MPKRQNLGRVKRYRRSFYNERQRRARLALKWLGIAAAIFAVGFFAAPAVLNWGTHTWYTVVKGRDLTSSSPAASASASAPESTASSAASSAPESTASPAPQGVGEGSWETLSLSALSDQTAIEQTAADCAARSVRYAVVTLKDASGYIYYPSAVPSAAGSIAATTVDAAAVAAALKAQGVTPVAYICAFQDPIAAYNDRSMGIHYAGSDYMWLDAKADAGGKPWLNPYSSTAVQFVGDLVAEAASMGYEQVVLSAVQFPTYVSAKQDFGDTQGLTRAQCLTADIAVWESRFAGSVTLWYEVPYASCRAVDTARDALPYELGIQNLILQMPTVSADDSASAASAPEAVTMADVVSQMKQGGCTYVVVRQGNTAALA